MGKIDRKPKFNTIDNIIKYLNLLPNRDRNETIKGQWTFEYPPTISTATPFFAGYLGTIEPTDLAPTPEKNGYYKFSQGGEVSWLDGKYVYAGDELSVVFNSMAYQHAYKHIKIIDRTTNTVSETLTTSSNGIDRIYTLSKEPMDKSSTSLYINGVYRDDYFLSGNTIVLDYTPDEDSLITIKYFTLIPTADYATDYDKLRKMEEFYDSFTRSLSILTHMGEPLTYQGVYLYVQEDVITIPGITDLIAENLGDDPTKLVDLALMLLYGAGIASDASNALALLQDQVNNLVIPPQEINASLMPPENPLPGAQWFSLSTGTNYTYINNNWVE